MKKYPSNEIVPSLLAIVSARAESHPDRVFLRDVRGDVATFAQCVDRIGRWITVLREVGVTSGDSVVTMVANSVDAVLLWLALVGCGAVEVPLHPALKGALLKHAIHAVGARLAVVETDVLAAFDGIAECIPGLNRIAIVGDAPARSNTIWSPTMMNASALLRFADSSGIEVLPDPSETAAVLFTSGTTGPSKPVVISWIQLQVTAQGTFVYDNLDQSDVLYVVSPPSHIGAKTFTHLAAMVGGSVVLRPSFKTSEFVPDLRQYGVTTTGLIGAMAQFLVSSPESSSDLELPLRNVVMGPVIPNCEEFAMRFGVRINTCFGMTELPVPIRSHSIENPASCGKVWSEWPHFEVRIVDHRDREVADGEVGELMVRCAVPWAITSGYAGMPEATVRAWRNGWFHTGDMFRRDPDGWLYFIDRRKDSIRRRGENISSFEVEAAALRHSAVVEAAAVAAPADTVEDEVRLFVAAAPGTIVEPAALHDHLRSELPRFMVPRYIDIVDELPKTPTLRTQKHLLRLRPVGKQTWDSSRQHEDDDRVWRDMGRS